MSILSMVEAKLPPGFRFHPRDDELICDYLAMKLAAGFNSSSMLVDVDLNKCEPWDLPATACVGGGKEWYFFSLRDRKYATGQRTNRATISGYWKATGKDRTVARKGVVVGMRKTLVFYQGRAPKGSKTEWVMHEYRSTDKLTYSGASKFHAKEDWVLCKVTYKSKGVSTKPTNMVTTHSNEDNELEDDNDDDNVSHSLPPLLDNNYIPFEQAPQHMQGFVQVPCFSNSAAPHCPTVPIVDNMSLHSTQFASSSFDQLSCDKEALRKVLDPFTTKMEPNTKIAFPPNLAGPGNLGAYLPVSGLPSHWNAF